MKNGSQLSRCPDAGLYTRRVHTVIVLVGFMGAGKTTVGRLLADRLRRPFTDLDDLVRARDGRSIPEIFRADGEPYFRQLESECLREILKSTQARVLAVGGGAFAEAESAAAVRKAGATVVFLDAEVGELLRRCAAEAGERPLLRDPNQFCQLYESRRQAYMAADVRVETGSLAPSQVAEEILRRLGLTRVT